MRRGFGLLLPVLFQLLALLTLPGEGNQGSVAGSCSCDRTISSGTQIPPGILNHIRKNLKAFHRCPFFIRFQLQSKSVCGGSRDQWVHELVTCFESKECGTGHKKSFHHQKLLPQGSTQIPEATEEIPPDTSTPAQIQSTQKSTLPSGTLSLNKELTQHLETTILPLGFSLEARPEAEANEKQQKEPGAGAGTAALVPVLSLLGIVFLLTAAMVYVLCKRRVTRQSSAGLLLYYTPVEPRPRC
ncbi:C-X-C motif chemokine 16 [Apodemus sylvaticus]|uniref:C-X-C motif chemokine 16 n=1 Tax=Apodemus sylvaticus TaxID=10129 RepID=UPI002241A7EF|nr:C-X-C motif chemokine 16 [Apodemus sylvaticus]